MASESPANDPGSPNTKQPIAGPSTPPPSQPATEPNGDKAAPSQPAHPPQEQQFYFNGEPSHDGTMAEPGGGLPVSYHGMPMFPYNTGGPMTRPKRTQCKNACTNCQKACKKCDDNRPCRRCIRYGTTDTCVDSKRKERKKGVKRGPYKTRDHKGRGGDAKNDDDSGPSSTNGVHVPLPIMPYVGPVGYPPGMWSSYSPGGPGAKVEGGRYYQPVFALTPVAGQGPQGGDGENAEAAAGGEGPPHFPVGFYPATFISYPGPYPPYPMPPGQGAMPHGFHYAYPPPPGVYPPRSPNVVANKANSEPGVDSSGPADLQNKDMPDSGAAADVEKSDPKDAVIEPQVNGKTKLNDTGVIGAVARDNE